jgi:hypothetical protein
LNAYDDVKTKRQAKQGEIKRTLRREKCPRVGRNSLVIQSVTRTTHLLEKVKIHSIPLLLADKKIALLESCRDGCNVHGIGFYCWLDVDHGVVVVVVVDFWHFYYQRED